MNTTIRTSGATKPIISVQNVSKTFTGNGGTKLTVLEDVSFELHPGEIVALLGNRVRASRHCCARSRA